MLLEVVAEMTGVAGASADVADMESDEAAGTMEQVAAERRGQTHVMSGHNVPHSL